MHGARVCEGRERPDDPTRRRIAAREDGWALMEVVVAATVLAIVVLAVLAGLDASARSSTSNRQRTVASALAEQDLERMRGMKVEDLSGYSDTGTMTVGGVDYDVTSSARWVDDDTGADVSCADDGSSAGTYLQISSSVEASRGAQISPVKLTSLMAPPVGAGQLAVRVRSATDQPVRDAHITISGPDPHGSPADTSVTDTGTTNDTGCVVFGFLPSGTYIVQMTDGGWVDTQGNSPAQTEQGVRPATVSTATLVADEAASITVQVQTKVGAAAPRADQAKVIQIANPALQPSGLRQFTLGSASLTIDGLFPFPAGYTIYSGCQASDPTKFGDADYFTSHPEAVPKPGPGRSATAIVREPALNVVVKRDGSPLSGAHVVVTSQTCGDSVELTTDSSGRLAAPGPGMPFGTYDVCADDAQSRWWRSHHATITGVENTDPDGTPVTTLSIDTRNGPTNYC